MAGRKRKATAIDQNPYIDLVDLDDDDDVDNQPDVRVFPAPPGYPTYLRPRDEIRARNRYVFTRYDKERQRIIDRCSYDRPIPSRGKCVMCGRSGALGEQCTNGCTYERWASENLVWAAQERKYKDDPDLSIREGTPTTYRILRTPEKGNMIDAVYWAEMMYQGVHEEQDNYQVFLRQPIEARLRRLDKIRSDQERWVDPWLWVFRLHDDCEWWKTVRDVSLSMGNDLEKPKPGKVHKYK